MHRTTQKVAMKLNVLLPALVGSAVLSLAVSASAQTTFTKANNNTSLNFASSYTSNSTVPGANDTILVDNTVTATLTAGLGGNLSINAFNYTASSQFQVSATANASLTIGSGGISKSGSANLIFANALTLGANQTWNIATGSMQVNNVVNNDQGYSLAVTGGTLDLRPNTSVTFGPTVTISSNISVNAVGANVTFGGQNTFSTFNIVSGRANVDSIGNFGSASAAGTGGTATAIVVGGATSNGTLSYTGGTTTTNRTITRDARSASSTVEVASANSTLTVTGAMGSGTQVNAGSNGWVFTGAGNLILTGVISNATGNSSTGTTITKTGAGALTLSANNTFNGAVTVSNGMLIANSNKSLGNSTSVTVSGGSLDVRGASAGTLTLGSNASFTMTSGEVKLTLGSAFDQIVSAGGGATFNLSGGSLVLDVTGAGFSYSNTYAVFSGFTGTVAPSLSITGYDTANYLASIDNQGTLSFVPEPSTWALMLLGAGGLALARRRRKA